MSFEHLNDLAKQQGYIAATTIDGYVVLVPKSQFSGTVKEAQDFLSRSRLLRHIISAETFRELAYLGEEARCNIGVTFHGNIIVSRYSNSNLSDEEAAKRFLLDLIAKEQTCKK